jgi:hypothetical protein
LVDAVLCLRYNTFLTGAKMSVKEQILAKLAEVENLLAEAECEGEQLAEQECYGEIDTTLNTLFEQVAYYVD